MEGCPIKVEKILGKNFFGKSIWKKTLWGAIMPTSSRITKTEGLHFKVGWDRVSPVGISLFDVEAKTISFQLDGGYSVEVQRNAERLWKEIE